MTKRLFGLLRYCCSCCYCYYYYYYILVIVTTSEVRSCLSLTCKICAQTEGDIHVDVTDNRRLSYDIKKPYCLKHDDVECSPNQDACITVVQPSSPNSYTYLITKGCSEKSKYASMGCTRQKNTIQGVQYEKGANVNSRQGRRVSVNVITEDTCVCDWSYCNSGPSNFRWSVTLLLFLLVFLTVLYM